MKTLTISEARGNLSSVLDRACHGEDIGIVTGNRIVHLKPVEIVAWEDSYVYREYGVTPEEWDRFRKRMTERRGRDRYREFKGSFDPKALD
jgi:antitoxin (DNA-binding transcriptional repressor) of toxin-antitoxin stability system